MKKHIAISLFTIALSLVTLAANAAVKIGESAPDFKLKNSSGENVSLKDFKDKIVVLEWTNHECPFVKKHYKSDNMQSLQKDYTAKDVVWLSIISSAPGKQGHVSAKEAMDLTAERKAAPTHVLFDPSGEVGKSYGAKTTPHMYVIDKKQNLQYMGAIDSIRSADVADIPKAKNYVDLALKAVMKNKEIADTSTRPYGCSVKY